MIDARGINSHSAFRTPNSALPPPILTRFCRGTTVPPAISCVREDAVQQKVIFFELNEVPFRILDEFCRWRPDSNLAKLLPRCTQFETVTEDEGHLSPWVTWPSLHRGI